MYILESKFVLDEAVKFKMEGDMGPKNREELKDSLDEICDQLGLVNGQDDRCSEQFIPFVQKIFSLPYEPVPGEKVIEEAKTSMMTYFKCLSGAIERLTISSLELFLLIPQCDIRKTLRDSRLHQYIETRLALSLIHI